MPGSSYVAHGDTDEEEPGHLRENDAPAPERGIDVQQAFFVQPGDQLEEVADHSPGGKPVARRHRFAYLPRCATAVDQGEHEARGLVDPNLIAGYGIEQARVFEQNPRGEDRNLLLEDHPFPRSFSLKNAAAITPPVMAKTSPASTSGSGMPRAASRGAAQDAAANTPANDAPNTA